MEDHKREMASETSPGHLSKWKLISLKNKIK